MQEAINTYLKFVPFQEFNLWDVKRYSRNANLKFENVVTLSDILIPYRNPVSKEEMIKNKWQIIAKINFGGDLFLRDFEEIHTYKGNVNLVPENAIIYSKINVRHGCIYYHEKGKTPFGVSSEYPTYLFDETKISGKFLHKILRSSAFKKLLNTKTSGISKARVKQDEFLDIQIPLPTLDEQEKIINNYYNLVEQAQIIDGDLLNANQSKENYLFDVLGVNYNEGVGIKNGLQTINYTDVEKWSLDDIFKKNTITSNKYSLVSLNEICNLITDGTHQTPTYFKSGVIFLSAKNVTKEVINWDDIKYVSQEAHNEYCKRVKPEVGDILLAKNGTTGVASIIDVEREFSIYVSLALLKPNKSIVNPLFLLYVINSKIARKQFFSRLIGIGVPNLHLGEIKEVLIPLPSLEVQKNIVDKVLSIKNQITYLENSRRKYLDDAEQQFEKQIFG